MRFGNHARVHHLADQSEKIAPVPSDCLREGVIGSDGIVLREIASGIGFVDVGVSFGGMLHLIELKILKKQVTGANQLANYMRTEGRNRGWLVLIDTRGNRHQDVVPVRIDTVAGLIMTVVVDVNPPVPHTT